METLQPKLRFQEFTGNWKKKKLSDISTDPKYGLNSSATVYDGVNKYIRITDIDEQSRKFKKDKITSPDYFDDNFLLKPDDLLFTRTGASTGKTYLYDESDGKLYFAGFLIKFNIINSNSKFVFYQTMLSSYDKWVQVMSMRSGQPGINAEEYNSLPLILPPIEEQTRIANFLSAIDEKLSLLKEKKALLEDYKKGIMQKIFNQETRFKDDNGNDFEDWENVVLGNISDVRDGTHDSPKYVNNGYPLITSKNLNSNGKLDFKNVEYITQIDFDKINKRSKVDVGDIIFGMIGTIGNPVLLQSDEFAIKNVALIKEKESLKNNFLIHYLNSSLIQNQFNKENVGGTQKFLSLGIIRNLEILLPSIEEQTKIANFLSAIDEKIDLVSNQIQDTQEYKKGLLQQLFV